MIHFWVDQSIPSKTYFYSKAEDVRMSGCLKYLHLILNWISPCFVSAESGMMIVNHYFSRYFANGTGNNYCGNSDSD